MSCRSATASDVPMIHALLVENAANDKGIIGGTEATLLRHGFGPDPKFRVVLAEKMEEVVGLALFFPEYSTWRGTVGAFVQDLYVRPQARGLGLGRALLTEVQRASADWESTFITLMVQRKNESARRFYAAQGFAVRGDADYLVLEGEALMRLLET